MISVRICLLLLIFVVWFWANSIFAPWATSIDPKLWLYDVLFYTRFVLLFWAAFELLHAWQQISNGPQQRKAALVNISIIGTAALTISTYFYLMHTGNGFRIRAGMSAEALDALRSPGYADIRQRAGWFLVDTQRQPCNDEAWLWLGNTYGAGTGNNLALVHSQYGVPKSPMEQAFRFWPVSKGWWLAYQNPTKYSAQLKLPLACKAGKAVESHEQGMKFISDTAD